MKTEHKAIISTRPNPPLDVLTVLYACQLSTSFCFGLELSVPSTPLLVHISP
jgi:hypothetical protein